MKGWLRRLPRLPPDHRGRPGARGPAHRAGVRGDDRERLHPGGAVQPGRRRLLAVPGRHRPGLRAGGQLLGRRAARSGEELGRGGAVPGRSVRSLRQLGAGAGRLQRRFSRRADQRPAVQHQRLLFAVHAGIRAALGDHRVRPQDLRGGHRRAQPGGVRLRRRGRPIPRAIWNRCTAPPGASFEAIARRLGITEDELALFNAAYLRRRAPPDRPAVVLQVPRGQGPAAGRPEARAICPR